MSRRRDTNWSKDEITVLLDSIMEITTSCAEDGKKTNSREVFEYAAKRMAEKGHSARAEREKCRTKWKKMKEEFTYAKRAREGDSRYKEAPGIQPFYHRMEEFINGNYDNISPHSTIVRRTSSMSSLKPSPTSGQRASARIAASTNGTPTNQQQQQINLSHNNDTSSTIVTKTTNISSDYPSSVHTTHSTNASPSSRQTHSRPSSSGTGNSSTTTNNNNNNNNNINNNSNTINASNSNNNNVNNLTALQVHTNGATAIANNSNNSTLSTSQQIRQHQHQSHQQPPTIQPIAPVCAVYTSSFNNSNNNNNDGTNINNNHNNTTDSLLNQSNDSLAMQPTEHADISYRVSSGCRQITIFGDHDVDIKFRGDCVTINKIQDEHP